MTFCTVEPNPDKMNEFVEDFNEQILLKSDSTLSIFGNRTKDITLEILPTKVYTFTGLDKFKADFLNRDKIL